MTVEMGLVLPNGVGDFSVNFVPDGQVIHRVITGVDGNGYAYQLGQLEHGSLAAVAGILPLTGMVDLPETGAIHYATAYQITTLENITELGGILRAETGRGLSGDILLTADFADQSLTGRSKERSEPDLIVNGTLDGNTLSGTVTVRGQTGNLAGVLDPAQVVGAFAGARDDAVFAGGFIGNAD